jgi:hypothetical protein
MRAAPAAYSGFAYAVPREPAPITMTRGASGAGLMGAVVADEADELAADEGEEEPSWASLDLEGVGDFDLEREGSLADKVLRIPMVDVFGGVESFPLSFSDLFGKRRYRLQKAHNLKRDFVRFL